MFCSSSRWNTFQISNGWSGLFSLNIVFEIVAFPLLLSHPEDLSWMSSWACVHFLGIFIVDDVGQRNVKCDIMYYTMSDKSLCITLCQATACVSHYVREGACVSHLVRQEPMYYILSEKTLCITPCQTKACVLHFVRQDPVYHTISGESLCITLC